MSADTPGAAAAVRPARRQVQKSKGPAKFDPKKQPPSGTYNIWYDKHDGRSAPREKSNTRCSIESDAGWTKGVADPQAWICFKFAQGRCVLGQDCGNLHCLPKGKFAAELPTARDCFGRERFATERDDRGGVGSFEKDPETQRTLYVGGLPPHPDMEKTLRTQFGEWGDVERVHVKRDGRAGFVQYQHRASAEFAKVAMADQSLFGKDLLNVRWSDVDHNPRATKKRKESHETALVDALAKRCRSGAHAASVLSPQIQQVAADSQPQGTGPAPKAPRPATPTLPPAPHGWRSQFDPVSGCAYYVNLTTGVSTWIRPNEGRPPSGAAVPSGPAAGLLVDYSDSDSDDDSGKAVS